MKTLIVAGNYGEATQCAKQRGLKAAEWRYAGNPQTLEGICNVKILRFGSWRQHPRINDIETILRGGKLKGTVSELDPVMYGDGRGG